MHTARVAPERTDYSARLAAVLCNAGRPEYELAKREQIGKKARFEIFKRDGFCCQYCGAHPPGVLLHVDHINPVANGGTNDESNLTTACVDCNSGKGARLLSDVPKSLDDRANEVREREEQLRGYSAIMDARRDRIESDAWRVVGELLPGETSLSRDWFRSIVKFIETLGVHEVLDAADAALSTGFSTGRRFKYFCGVCWNKVRVANGDAA